MRRIVLSMSMSLGGYIEGPDHDISWHRADGELHRYFNDQPRGLGAFLLGRTTYELMESYWPDADTDPGATPPEVDFAAIWRETPKVVYSRTLDHAGPRTTIVRDVVPDEVRALTAQDGGDLGLGGAGLAATFLGLGLVDEYRVFVHPVTIGRGTPLFPPAEDRVGHRLTETKTFGNGVVLLRYEREDREAG
jgi:dihydrofolate reductase